MVISPLETERHPMTVFKIPLWTRNQTPCWCFSSFSLKKILCPSYVVVSQSSSITVYRVQGCSICTCGQGQVMWTFTRRNKTFPPSTSLPAMGEIAGVNTESLGGYHHSSKKRAGWAEGFHDELNGHVYDLERDRLRQAVSCPWLTIWWKQATIPYRIGHRQGQQGLRLPPYTRTEVSNMLLAHHRRFVEQTKWPLAHGTRGH